ncbi:MAG TPA: CGLD27 family protein [Trichocoleus sp.]
MTSRCPVPVEQQPINEYQDVRESWFYSWGSRDLGGYLKPVVILWLLSWSFAGPIAAASFAPAKHPALFCLSAAMGAFTLPILALVQLYIGWFHVAGRLRQQSVPYEESGWYDGQVWVKPEDVVSRDRLIVDYQVKPILRRIQKTFGAIAGLLAAGLIVWQFV